MCRAVCHAINRNAMPQVRQDEHLQIKTVKDLVTEEGRHLIPQLLGALALAPILHQDERPGLSRGAVSSD